MSVSAAIVATLKEVLTDMEIVGNETDMAGLVDVPHPSTWVLPGKSSVSNGIETETISIVIIDSYIPRNTDELVQSVAVDIDAQRKIVEAQLNGTIPESGYGPLRYVGRIEPLYEAGYAEFEFLYETDRSVSRQCD